MRTGCYLVVEVGISPNDFSSYHRPSIFTQRDENFANGDILVRPPDFNLHLAVSILKLEGLPPLLLDSLERWARENKTAGVVSASKGE